MRSFSTAIAVAVLLAQTGFSNIVDPLQSYNRDKKNQGKQLGAAKVVQVHFNPEDSNLTEVQKAEIRKLIDEARSEGTIRQLKVVAWSDYPYPSDQELPREQSELAKRRSNQIEHFIATELKLGKNKIQTYNMAKKPNIFQKLLKTPDALLKEQIHKTIIDPPLINGEPSSALLFVYF